MKHLKIYEKFEYSDDLNNKIKNAKPVKEHTMYMIGLPSAIRRFFSNRNNHYYYVVNKYQISDFAKTKEELELKKATKKYNL